MEVDEGLVRKKITIGVCVMEKKVKCGSEVFSAPMGQILERVEAFGEFEIIHFGDKVILEDPIESWPICDCLIAFYSNGYPLDKAEAYAALRKPFLVNELEPQHLLHDRRKVYEQLEIYGIPVPRYAFVNREVPYQELEYFIEEEDFVEVHGNRFWKPFVEKPVHGDDHSIMIYYPSSAGGGMKELFRKVGNRSSEFHPDVRRVRREGSYIYEEFMPTGGTDVKVEYCLLDEFVISSFFEVDGSLNFIVAKVFKSSLVIIFAVLKLHCKNSRMSDLHGHCFLSFSHFSVQFFHIIDMSNA